MLALSHSLVQEDAGNAIVICPSYMEGRRLSMQSLSLLFPITGQGWSQMISNLGSRSYSTKLICRSFDEALCLSESEHKKLGTVMWNIIIPKHFCGSRFQPPCFISLYVKWGLVAFAFPKGYCKRKCIKVWDKHWYSGNVQEWGYIST